MKHYIAYTGHGSIALGAMTEEYVPLITAGINNESSGIEGTRQRAPHSLESSASWIAGLAGTRGQNEVFAVLRKEQEEGAYGLIGCTGLHGISWPDGVASTGSMLFGTDAQGAGYGTEAKLLLLRHAFDIVGVRKVTSSVKAFNARSLGHLIKCGYTIVGRRKRQDFHQGTYVDEILLEVFRDEWLLVWERYQGERKLPKLTDKQREIVQKETTT